MNPTNHIDARPLNDLLAAAAKTRDALGLKHTPTVIRDEAAAFRIAGRTKAGVVMLGDGAYWVVCLADAARLEDAGFEWAPRG
ncbi:MAG: hypothetical protein JNK25_11375 [Phycisphaerae bacterium]|nr:hypothetical protein [Phycisphaerae bacterium]